LTADTNDNTINYDSFGEAVYAAADSETEVEKIALTELHRRAREKIKAASGMKTTEQAIKEVKEETRGQHYIAVQKLAEEQEPDIRSEKNFLVPPTNEEMRHHVRRVDRALAAHIKRTRELYCSGRANKMMDDAQFYEMFRLANHSADEPKEEFYSMVEDLKRKKLL
jgi:hypothetical protein